MRASIALLIFFILLNGWAGLMQEYGINDHIGITAETGDPQQLEDAQNASSEFDTGDQVGGTLLGMYNNLGNTVEQMLVGLQPGARMLMNLAPPGVVEDIIMWLYAVVQILMGIDLLAYWRGVDL